jgi:hypothetical protein
MKVSSVSAAAIWPCGNALGTCSLRNPMATRAILMWWLCILWYGASLSATRRLDLIVLWHRMWAAAWERHDGRQAVVVTRFLIPRRRQLRRVCICHRATACLSTCQQLYSCHGLDATFLGPNKSAEWTKEHYNVQPSVCVIEVDWFLVTEFWSSHTQTLEIHLWK